MQALPYRTVGTTFAASETREAWLNNAWSVFATIAEAHGHTVPRIQMAVGYGPRGYCKGVKGETWAKSLSGGETYTIFIDPQEVDRPTLLRIVAHEGAHAIDDLVSEHRSSTRFAKLVELFGLEAPYTTTPIAAHSRSFYGEVARALGAYPHAKFTPVGTRGAERKEVPGGGRVSTGRPRQGTYMQKMSCADCGYIARATNKWIDAYGAVICPCNGQTMATG